MPTCGPETPTEDGLVGLDKVGVGMGCGQEQWADGDAPVRVEGSQRMTSEHYMMCPWQQLCQMEMINKPYSFLLWRKLTFELA